MGRNAGTSTFQFINISDVHEPEDPITRKIIRRQAMSKAAAARRQKRNYGQINLRQYPIFVQEESRLLDHCPASKAIAPKDSDLCTTEAVVSARDADQRPIDKVRDHQVSASLALSRTIPASLPSIGYESMRIQYDFDILNLSALTSFHSGRVTAHVLSHEPSRLANVLRCRQWSYLSFLPSRFGHTACLDDAINCIAAKARYRLVSPGGPLSATVVKLYSKALASLQTALGDPAQCLQSEVLCATQVLAIVELLNSTGEGAWIRHIAGAISLVKLRGPGSYTTDFEKALFLAQAGANFTEALFTSNSCFLEENAWQAVFRSMIVDSHPFAERSGIAVRLWACICRIPTLYTETEDAVNHADAITSPEIDELTSRLCHVRDSLVDWYQEYQELLSQYSNYSAEQARTDKRYEMLGAGLTTRIVINRLILALNLDMAERLENDSQSIACQIMAAERKAYAANPRAAVFMAVKMVVAKATFATKDDWQSCASPENRECNTRRRMITKEVFGHWGSLQGRKKRK